MINKDITIGLNGSMLDEQPTGVGVYAFNVINNLSRLYWKERWQRLTVFSPTPSQLSTTVNVIKLPNLLQSSKYGKLAAFCRFMWNTFYYPFHARRFDLLISPTTHGSLVSGNQVITIHDLLSLRFKNISWHQRIYFKYVLPAMVSRARLIITVSETSRQDIIHYLDCPPEKVHAIYNGYDHLHYTHATETGDLIARTYNIKNYLLAVGPTYPHKNFETLIRAYGELDEPTRQRHPLAIAGGKKKYLAFLKNFVREQKLEAYVQFLGYVPFEKMPALYREAVALVFPSLYEGFGIPLLEAMACGCPVLTSNISSMPEVCENAALYFDPLDKNDIASAIRRIVSDQPLRAELQEKGLMQSKKFSWDRTAQTLKTVIENNFKKSNTQDHV